MTVKEVSSVRKRLLILQSDVRLFIETFFDGEWPSTEMHDTVHCKQCGQVLIDLHLADLITHQLRHYPA